MQHGSVQEMCKDAERYRFLRDEDNWGAEEDDDTDIWEILGESHGAAFDEIVDFKNG